MGQRGMSQLNIGPRKLAYLGANIGTRRHVPTEYRTKEARYLRANVGARRHVPTEYRTKEARYLMANVGAKRYVPTESKIRARKDHLNMQAMRQRPLNRSKF